MNKKPNYSEMPTEELQILRNKQKKIWTAFASIWIIILLVYLGINIYKGFEKFNFPASIPIFILPITLLPIYTTFATMDKELKSRKK
ncbi:hypothetical protein [Soonwooa sp.]|uniref:hypothetical protein n=1 Tax=Soonwooa sp. TaxID=1938592 RepID=UPI00289B9A70|nr:hypothetical protein [Soonwooa sp.]